MLEVYLVVDVDEQVDTIPEVFFKRDNAIARAKVISGHDDPNKRACFEELNCPENNYIYYAIYGLEGEFVSVQVATPKDSL